MTILNDMIGCDINECMIDDILLSSSNISQTMEIIEREKLIH